MSVQNNVMFLLTLQQKDLSRSQISLCCISFAPEEQTQELQSIIPLCVPAPDPCLTSFHLYQPSLLYLLGSGGQIHLSHRAAVVTDINWGAAVCPQIPQIVFFRVNPRASGAVTEQVVWTWCRSGRLQVWHQSADVWRQCLYNALPPARIITDRLIFVFNMKYWMLFKFGKTSKWAETLKLRWKLQKNRIYLLIMNLTFNFNTTVFYPITVTSCYYCYDNNNN